MRVCGGKSVTGGMIAGVLEAVRADKQVYRETMCAGLGCFQHMSSGVQTHPDLKEKREVGRRIGSDMFGPIIDMWNTMREEYLATGAVNSFPLTLTKDEWLAIKKNPKHPHYAFAGFAFGFKGVFFRSFFVTPRDQRPPCIKKVQKVLDRVSLFTSDYRDLAPIDELVYIDPVYVGRDGGLDHSVAAFNSSEMWDIAHHWMLPTGFYNREETTFYPTMLIQAAANKSWVRGSNNTVLVSEYVAPECWRPLASWEALKSAGSKTAAGGSHNPKPPKHEHLFAHVSRVEELRELALRRLNPGTRSHRAVLMGKEERL